MHIYEIRHLESYGYMARVYGVDDMERGERELLYHGEYWGTAIEALERAQRHIFNNNGGEV